MKACYICTADALFRCKDCGRDVCREHFSHDTGRCSICDGKVVVIREITREPTKKSQTRQKAKRK